MGAMIVSDRLAAPFLDAGASFAHGLTFGGHPVAAAVALANLDVSSARTCSGTCGATSPSCGRCSRGCATSRSSATCAARASSGASSWSPTRAAKRAVPAPTRRRPPIGFLGPALCRRGLICRAADRGYPVIQLAPPLVAGPEEFAEIARILRGALEAAAARFGA